MYVCVVKVISIARILKKQKETQHLVSFLLYGEGKSKSLFAHSTPNYPFTASLHFVQTFTDIPGTWILLFSVLALQKMYCCHLLLAGF